MCVNAAFRFMYRGFNVLADPSSLTSARISVRLNGSLQTKTALHKEAVGLLEASCLLFLLILIGCIISRGATLLENYEKWIRFVSRILKFSM